MYLILFDTNKTNKNIDMEEKAKTVDMFGLDPSLDTYYDEEERENVENVQYEWDYINKYHFSTSFDDDEEEELEAFSDETRELLYDFRDRIRALRQDAISMKALEEYERILYEVNSELCEEDDEPEFVIDKEHLEKVKEDKRARALQQRLKELTEERQRYEESIQEEEVLIAKLKERNAAPSVIADEQTIIDNSKKAIEELDKQIEVLNEQ
jgi:hypothetical protein